MHKRIAFQHESEVRAVIWQSAAHVSERPVARKNFRMAANRSCSWTGTRVRSLRRSMSAVARGGIAMRLLQFSTVSPLISLRIFAGPV